MASTSLSLCKIGMCLNEDCHKLTYCRKTGLIPLSEFKQEDRQLLQWRCGIYFTDQDEVCLHHEKIYLSRYESLQKYCSDPFTFHKKRITKIGGKLMDENQDDVKPVNLPEVQLAVQETEATVTRELRAALRRLHREMDEDKEQALHSQKQYYDKLSQRVARERDLAEEERLKEMSLHLENMKQVALREQQEHAEHERDKAIKQNLTEQATRLRAEFEHEKAQAVQEALKKAKELKSELNSEKKRASESLEEHTQEMYRKHEQRVVESTRRACDEKARAELEQVQKRYQLEIDQLELRYATLEQKYCKNMNQKERVEADFKALQDDYKKFMDYTEGMFHSDYLMKLRKHGMKLACQVIPTVTSSRESTLQRSSARDMSVKSNHRHISAEESIHSQRCSSQRTDL